MFVAGAGRRGGRVVAAVKRTAQADAGPDGSFPRTATGLAGLLLLVAVTAGLLGQGAYYASVQWYLILLAKSVVVYMGEWGPLSGVDG